jgi:hypothetical protein
VQTVGFFFLVLKTNWFPVLLLIVIGVLDNDKGLKGVGKLKLRPRILIYESITYLHECSIGKCREENHCHWMKEGMRLEAKTVTCPLANHVGPTKQVMLLMHNGVG